MRFSMAGSTRAKEKMVVQEGRYSKAALANSTLHNSGALQSALSQRMITHLLQGILECSASYEKARLTARKCGMLAGEDFLYNHLDLGAPPEQFVREWEKMHRYTGFPSLAIQCENKETGCLRICFNCLRGCRAGRGGKPLLQCHFMQGYLLGVLECYCNCKNELKVYCASAHHRGKEKTAAQCRCEVRPILPLGPLGLA